MSFLITVHVPDTFSRTREVVQYPQEVVQYLIVPSPANILAACQYIGRYIEGFHQFISLVFKARKLDQEWQWGPYGSHLGPHIFLYDI